MTCEADLWSVIGTWVGGLGSAAAAGVAVWVTLSDNRRRKKYSDFLLRRDIATLKEARSKLQEFAERLEFLDSSNANSRELSKRLLPGLNQDLRKLIAGLVWFGNAEQQFFHPRSEDVISELQAYIDSLVATPEYLEVALERDGAQQTADVARSLANQLELVLSSIPGTFLKKKNK